MASYSAPVDCNIDFNPANLAGKTAVVTGAALAKPMFEHCTQQVVFGDRNTNTGQKLAAELPGTKFVQCDVTKWEDQVRLFKEAAAFSPSGKIHHVIANAGITNSDDVFTFDGSDQGPQKPDLRIIDVNLYGALYTTKLALHYFISQNGTEASPNMDPFNTLSAVAAVVQLVDFGTRLLKTSVEVYKSPSGHTAKEVEVSTVLDDLTTLAERAREEIARPRPLIHGQEQDELLGPILANIDIIAKDFEGAMNTLLSKGIYKLYGGGGPKKKGIGGALISTLNASKTRDLTDRLEQMRTRVIYFSVHDIWVESRESRRREIEFGRKLDQLIATTERIEGGTHGEQDARKNTAEIPGDMHSRRLSTMEVQGVVHSLKFEAMQSRDEAIHGAFDKTLRWIMDTGPSPSGKPFFPDWLEEDTGEPFWITGKPGSGKSTLMKHILDDPQWTKRLEKWADGLPLCVMSYYAWIAGSKLQKAIEGLLRTILFQCLQRLPALASTVAPRRWAFMTTTGSDLLLPEWTIWELEESLDILLDECGKSIKIAVFVDGLDEFDTGPTDLLKLIQKLCLCTGVKVVVASREWQEFRDALHKNPMLRMQDLTAGDMSLFVDARFNSTEGYHDLSKAFPAEAAALKNEVVARANGVFLWLSLVVTSLVESLSDGATLSELHAAVNSLPSDIADLYNTIWSGISGRNITAASELVAIVMAATDDPLRFMVIWLGREGNIDDLGRKTRKPDGILDIVRRRVSSSTRGILEVLPSRTVDFLHRTARDWASKPDVWENICSHLSEEFDANLTITTGKALLRSTGTTGGIDKPDPTRAFKDGFFDDLLLYASKVKGSPLNTPKLIRILDFYRDGLQESTPKNEGIPGIPDALLGSRRRAPVSDPFMELAALFCVLPYLRAKVHRKPGLISRTATIFGPRDGIASESLLAFAVLGADPEFKSSIWYPGSQGSGADSVSLATRLKTVAFLLESGASGRQTWTDSERPNDRNPIMDEALLAEPWRGDSVWPACYHF
ncbi:uncharacterized protein DNG_06825 [Cephalotrichum gorgonifer]|uniref:NACHT domain-containing protein n=1 Tax=Cephalotrichum gorgonifer TaxID=2041049 RepID=A0AAE8SXP0_9PEZI|nr:uncharacterized protein DNG_06825 [Cephalotrichum gorgonifer]